MGWKCPQGGPTTLEGVWNHGDFSSAKDVRGPAGLSWANPSTFTAGSFLCPGAREKEWNPRQEKKNKASVSLYASLREVLHPALRRR